jgi:ribosomal protein RSM22 (predicted rRNA methylase)
MAELPRELADGVARLLHGVSARELSRASSGLSAKYRQKQERRAPVARSQAEILAYAASRLPATYAAVTAAFSAVRELRPEWQPRTMLDLGAGPGTGMWAAAHTWPSLERGVAVDAEQRMLALGQQLAGSAAPSAVRSASWVRAAIAAPSPDGAYDLVLLAYVLGELDAAGRDEAVERAIAATAAPAGLTVVVEPGTPEGYARVLRARERLLEHGGHVAAPCPHESPCPLARPDWCHFAVRLPRTAAHRAAKLGALAYEDEKFSYVAASRQPSDQADARVLRHPQIRPRLVRLQLCTPEGIRSAAIARSDRERFKLARKVAWGDRFPYTESDEATHRVTGRSPPATSSEMSIQ